MSIQRKYPITNDIILLHLGKDKDARHRVQLFLEWLNHQDGLWYQPYLDTYRDYLLDEYVGRDQQALAASSVKAHLSTIRSHYQALLRDNRVRDSLYGLTPDTASPAERKAYVDEIVKRLENAIDPANSEVQIIKRQDIADEEHLRLTSDQATALMTSPGTLTLMGLRDTAVIALMLCTGAREAELCALDVPDLTRKLSGSLALHIRRGKGAKERLVPYGSLVWVLQVVERWLENAGIKSGAVFRGFYKTGKAIRERRLTTRSINLILDKYPIYINGDLKVVNPHDLRRTYARRLYEAGVDLLAIRDNLGHSDSRTTLRYIGVMDVEARKPPDIYPNPLG
jgi:site-specific recombinase XerD